MLYKLWIILILILIYILLYINMDICLTNPCRYLTERWKRIRNARVVGRAGDKGEVSDAG